MLCMQHSLRSLAQHALSLSITTSRTTTLVFPYPVKSVDRGSADVLAQIVPETSNVLRIKAARKNFMPTNLTVITNGGELFEFALSYHSEPGNTLVRLASGQAATRNIQLPGSPVNEASLKMLSEKVLGHKANIHLHDKSGLITAELNGVYTADDILLFRIEMTNHSSLGYELAAVRFFISDTPGGKRTAVQRRDLIPVYSYPHDNTVIQQGSTHPVVFALPKLTLDPRKYLGIEVLEKSGERSLNLKLRNKHILRAGSLDE